MLLKSFKFLRYYGSIRTRVQSFSANFDEIYKTSVDLLGDSGDKKSFSKFIFMQLVKDHEKDRELLMKDHESNIRSIVNGFNVTLNFHKKVLSTVVQR